MTDLLSLGYGPFHSQQVDLDGDADLAPARVVADLGSRLLLGLEGGERLAVLPAALRGKAAVGDWVLCELLPDGGAVLRRVLARRSVLSRQAAGAATGRQILAANVDWILIVEPLEPGPNLRRLERMLAAGRASGAEPAVLLTKADLRPAPEVAAALEAVRAAAPETLALAVSARSGEGLEAVSALLAPGATAVLVGLSGAGKSTLVNALLGQAAEPIGQLAADGRGRHTTTRRRLWRLPGGALLVDGPGIRELQLWEPGGVEAAFADVAALAGSCRFRDCAHRDEPGCAVREAVRAGKLDAGRLTGFHKLAREAAALEARHDAASRLAARRVAKARERALRDLQRRRGR